MAESSNIPELVDLLVERLRASQRGNRAIQGFLRAVKMQRSLGTRELLTSGNRGTLLEHLRDAVAEGFIPVDNLARFVDRVEENGGQHIFLFDLTPEGVVTLQPDALETAFPPSGPNAAMYEDVPKQPRIHFEHRPDALVVKQIHSAGYWRKDEARSEAYSEEGVRAVFQVEHRCRALNILRVLPERGQAEIRIDRLTSGLTRDEIGAHFQAFLSALSPVLDEKQHLSSTPIWRGFGDIVDCRDGTYMRVDRATDPSVNINISNRREGTIGRDVRDHPSYELASQDYTRDVLSVSWITEWLLGNDSSDDRGDPERVHTTLSKFTIDGRDYGKIYVAASVSPEVLSCVSENIRHFAREVS